MKGSALFLFLVSFSQLILFTSCKSDLAAVATSSENVHTDSGKTYGTSVKIANWNLQTFFDSTPDGTEYSGFTKNDKSWTSEKYSIRLERLCSVITQIDADIIAFEEIENAKIIYDIINNYDLQGRRDKSYNYACFASEEGQAFGVALLSRYPILDYSVHQVDVRSEKDDSGVLISQPRMRPVLKALVQIENTVFSVYVCHWKSKSSGAEASEIWRNYSENQLAYLISKDTNHVFITGDFNRDLKEFNINTSTSKFGFVGSVELGRLELTNALLSDSVLINSAWLSESATSCYETEGTYFYQERWEKLDHFFFSNDITLKSFSTVKFEENTTESGTPYRYSVWNGKGVSDHLPIVCVIGFL